MAALSGGRASTQHLERLACVACKPCLRMCVDAGSFIVILYLGLFLVDVHKIDASLAGSRAFSCDRVHSGFLRWALSRTHSPNIQLIAQNNSLFLPDHVAS